MANIQTQNVLPEAPRKEKNDGNALLKIPDSYMDDLTNRDMLTVFPKLVRGGQFVNALEAIHGHGRFHWFYTLFEKVSKRLFCEREKSEALDGLELPAASES